MKRGERPLAFTAVLARGAPGGSYSLGIAEENRAGYTPWDKDGTFETYEEAMAMAHKKNKEMGLTPERAFEIVASSMGAGSQR